MPRLYRGGRGVRGYRGRGRRGPYRGSPAGRGGRGVSSPQSQFPATTTHHVSPTPPTASFSNQQSGALPNKRVNTENGSWTLPSTGITPLFEPKAPPTLPTETSGGVSSFSSDDSPATNSDTKLASTSSIPSLLPATEDSKVQQHHEALDNSSTETKQHLTTSADGGAGDQNTEGVAKGSQEDRECSPGMLERYLYGTDGNEETVRADNVLGKRKEPPSSVHLPEEQEGDENDGADNSPKKKAKVCVSSPHVLTPEVVQAINKDVIGMVKNADFAEEYVCTLCLALMNSRRNLEKHLGAGEHMRRVGCVHNPASENVYHFCETCYVTCLNEEVYSNHIKGKKHAKYVQLSSRIKTMVIIPLGNSLEGLLKKEIVKSGDGLTLGLSTSMMKFFTMEGPFIGLQYAEEVGVENDPNPGYRCTLCNVTVDGGNQSLHFTSTAHRMNVLKKDYPEKFAVAKETSETADKKSELSIKLREICAEIEGREGRKVELINRVIVSSSLQKGGGRASHSGATPYRGHAVSGSNRMEMGGTSSHRGGYGGQGKSPWQPQQRGRGRGRGSNFPSSNSTQSRYGGYSDRWAPSNKRGGFNSRGRGHRGRGTSSQPFVSDESTNSSELQPGYASYSSEQPQPLFRGNSHSGGRGRGKFGAGVGSRRGAPVPGYDHGRRGGHQNQPWSSGGPSHVPDRNPPVPPLQLNTQSSFVAPSYQSQPRQSPSFQGQSPSFQIQSPSFPGQSPSFRQPVQSPSHMFGAPQNVPSMLPPVSTPISSPYSLMQGPQHIVQSPIQRFPDQISPSSPWAPPTKVHLEQTQPQQHVGYGQPQYDNPYDQRQYQHTFGDGGGGRSDPSFPVPGSSFAPPQGSQGPPSDPIRELEGTVIESEEEAEQALRLSRALTQKLLAYRFKTVSSSNPIMSLLNTLQASGMQPPAP